VRDGRQTAAYQQLVDELYLYGVSEELKAAFAAAGHQPSAAPAAPKSRSTLVTACSSG
jgi:hypothetical protein